MNFKTKFGNITLIKRNKGKVKSVFKCHCGEIFETKYHNIVRGDTKSCGCIVPNQLEGWDYSQGKPTNHPLYSKWLAMKDRCYNQNHSSYAGYGGKGVVLCDEWEESFINFYKWSINNGWELGLSIDRINPRGDYAPDNCRFITVSENTSRMLRHHRKLGTGVFSESKKEKVREKARKNQGKSVLLSGNGITKVCQTIGDAAKFIVDFKKLNTRWQRVKSNVSACCLGKRRSCHGFYCEFI